MTLEVSYCRAAYWHLHWAKVRLRLELQGVTLPSSLQSLTFGYKFDQDLKGVMLLSGLQTWTFVYRRAAYWHLH